MNNTEGYAAIRDTAASFSRGKTFVEVTGPGRQPLLSHVIARPTQYSQAGTIIESLMLDDHGRVIDLVLCLIDEDRVLLVSEQESSALGGLKEIATLLGIDDVQIYPRAGWAAVAIEGPKSWKAIADIPREDIASLLLNEWREIEIPVADAPAVLARTGGTAEYGYVLLAEADSEVLLGWLSGLAATVGGGACSAAAVKRARLEVNHPVLDGQFEGIGVAEAGVAWMAGMERDDEFRGRAASTGAPRRSLVAVESLDDIAHRADVTVGERVVGHMQVIAPRVGQKTAFGLALLDSPFDVPGLNLAAGGVAIRTVARPAVNPMSWTQGIE